MPKEDEKPYIDYSMEELNKVPPFEERDRDGTAGLLGGAAGATGGAFVGAGLGSAFGPVGTALGFAAGATGGAAVGATAAMPERDRAPKKAPEKT